jgi:hypothetical protein
MSDLTLVSLDFDACHGPAVKSIDGPLSFPEPILLSIQTSAFPESALPLPSAAHVYSFVVASFYCHCVYIRKISSHATRGFRIFAFVMVTELGFLEPVFDLLRSVRAILSRRYADILLLMASMFRTWSKILTDASEKVCDFPLFDGPAMYASAPASRLQLLGSVQCEADLQMVWEHLILGRPVIILGSTPAVASRAVLELSWLVQNFSAPRLIPYISVSDSRFPALVKAPEGIIGVSNPIAPSLMPAEVALMRVGFPARTFSWPFMARSNSTDGFYRLLRNTEALSLAVGDAVGPGGAGAVRPRELAKRLAERGVETAAGLGDFAARLIDAPAFAAESRRKSVIVEA